MFLAHKIYLYSFIILSFGSVLLGTAYSLVDSPLQKSDSIIAQAHASYESAQDSDDVLAVGYHIQNAIRLSQKAKIYNPSNEIISKEILFFKAANVELENSKTELSFVLRDRP